jgi:hypothetical protein
MTGAINETVRADDCNGGIVTYFLDKHGNQTGTLNHARNNRIRYRRSRLFRHISVDPENTGNIPTHSSEQTGLSIEHSATGTLSGTPTNSDICRNTSP